jgi:hypothetical protein
MGKVFTGRTTRAVVTAALIGAVLTVGSVASTGAAVTKTIVGVCTGADAASNALISALGGSSLAVPFSITSDVPPTLEPEQSGSPIAFTWNVALDQGLIDRATGLGLNSLTIKNAKLNIKVSGPTSTTAVNSAGIPDRNLTLTKGQPASITEGPFSGKLEGVGKGGLIKYSAGEIALTIVATVAGSTNNVNVTCSAPGTVATTSIKIPGSPDVTQPIEVNAQANQDVTVDVLGQFVKAGKDEKGKEFPVDPSTLKVLEGPATVSGGKLVVKSGAPGTVASATFEVCSGTLPGVNEVQRLIIDPTPDALKKGVAFKLQLGDKVTAPIDLLAFPFGFIEPAKGDWPNVANNYIFTVHELPTPAALDAALEALPNVGAGGVNVTQVPGKAGQYDIEFTGANGQKDIPSLTAPEWYSVFPQEILAQIFAAAGELTKPPTGPTTTTTLPPGVDNLREYFDLLVAEGSAALNAGNFDLAGQKLGQALALIPAIILGDLDVQALLQQITGLFTAKPSVDTLTAGEEPIGICSQGVVDVKVASVSTTSAGGGSPSAVQAATATKGASLAFAG